MELPNNTLSKQVYYFLPSLRWLMTAPALSYYYYLLRSLLRAILESVFGLMYTNLTAPIACSYQCLQCLPASSRAGVCVVPTSVRLADAAALSRNQ